MTELEYKAPVDKFRVIGVDTFDGTDWVHGDFDTYGEARAEAQKLGGAMLKTHVYDDQGNHLFEAGKF